MSAPLRLTFAVGLALAMLSGAGIAIGAPKAPASSPNTAKFACANSPKGEEPVDLSSDEAHVNEANRTVVLTGNVVARQGAVQLQADSVVVHYLAAGSADAVSKSKIESLEASGNVVVTRPGEVVKGMTATYKMIEKQILMRGNVVARRGTSVVSGDNLVVDLVKETISLRASSSDGRVHAIFAPPTNGSSQ